MRKEQKAQLISGLEASFGKCRVGILTDYRGLSAQEMVRLRKKLRAAGIEYRVVKNTLARFAAEKTGWTKVGDTLHGPMALALGYDDLVAPARVLTDYISATKSTLTIKGGFIGDKLLTTEDVAELSKLPSREVLVAKVLGAMQAPIVSLVYTLNAPLSGLARLLQARASQMEAAK
jgi:large subunit ribosomal protein L10